MITAIFVKKIGKKTHVYSRYGRTGDKYFRGRTEVVQLDSPQNMSDTSEGGGYSIESILAVTFPNTPDFQEISFEIFSDQVPRPASCATVVCYDNLVSVRAHAAFEKWCGTTYETNNEEAIACCKELLGELLSEIDTYRSPTVVSGAEGRQLIAALREVYNEPEADVERLIELAKTDAAFGLSRGDVDALYDNIASDAGKYGHDLGAADEDLHKGAAAFFESLYYAYIDLHHRMEAEKSYIGDIEERLSVLRDIASDINTELGRKKDWLASVSAWAADFKQKTEDLHSDVREAVQ